MSNSCSSSSAPSCHASCMKLIIEELLECQVCLDFAISPIYSCKNGHILCGCCFEKVKKCGSCEEQFGPSGLAERIASKHHETEIPCRNAEPGCRLLFESTKVYAHLQDCPFRPIKCLEEFGTACGSNVYDLNVFCTHLTENHAGRMFDIIRHHTTETIDTDRSIASVSPATCTIVYGWTIDTMESSKTVGERQKLPVSYFEYDGKMFLLHRGIDQGLFMWITVLGGLNETEDFKYTSNIKISSTVPQSDDVEPSFVLPVQPIHGNYDPESVLESGSCAFIHPRSIKKLFREILHQDNQEALYRWKIVLEIKKLLG